MGRLIDADALNFNADYNEPLISKFDFDQAPTIHAIPIEEIKKAREEISDYNIKERYFGSDSFLIGIANGMDKAVEILDKLIAESEGKE